jgi:hypothetical protein
MKRAHEPKAISRSAVAGVRVSGALVAALWNLLAGIAFVFSRLDRWPSPLPELTTIPVAVGLVLVVRRLVRSRRETPPLLFVTPARPASGAPLTIRLAFSHPAFEGRRVVAVVRCDRVTTWQDAETTAQRLWAKRCGMTVRSGGCEGRLELPSALPERRSPEAGTVRDRWHLVLNCGGYWLEYPL